MPSYWVEKINGDLYDAILDYMQKNNITTKREMAKHLGISRGRMSQILNSGDINFSLEKIIDIGLKVDKYPEFSFVDKGYESGYISVKSYVGDMSIFIREKKTIAPDIFVEEVDTTIIDLPRIMELRSDLLLKKAE